MSDLDVQDVRDLVAKQKADEFNDHQLMLKMKRMADNPAMQREDAEMLEQLKAASSRQERAKRLGLEPESSKE